ncbi:MAG TPA: alkaline phosphatase family protein [Myxococcota bacterium]|nr:alkaline phosphatase family protein [Myxococcota bacterium]
MSPRLLALAIDAANADLVERWAADGTLPVLRGLLAEGLSGRTRSVEGLFVGSTWPSLTTALSPARHGYHSLSQLRPGSYEPGRPQDGARVHGEPFWDHLARCGVRSAVLDVPLARPSGRLAAQVVEWGSHSTLYGFGAKPERLAAELAAHFGARAHEAPCAAELRTPEAWAGYVARLEREAARKGELTRFVLAREPVDFALQVFSEAHCAGHHAWHLHDPAHPSHDAALAAALGAPLRRVYAAVDAAIGAVIADWPAATVVVFAAHGMSHLHGAQFLLRDVLVRLGVTAPATPRPPTSRERAAGLAGGAWLGLPAPLRRALQPLKARVWRGPTPAPRGLGVDAAASLCFPVSNGLAVGGIRLNLAGREPAGRLAPGAEADAFSAELAAELCALRDERTGRALVRAVRRTRDLWQGERLDALPDLLVEWSDDAPLGSSALANGRAAAVRAVSPRLGVLESVNAYDRTGEHRSEGFFVARGPGIAPGRLARVVSTLDLAPSFCARLGAPMTGVDGRALDELVATG